MKVLDSLFRKSQTTTGYCTSVMAHTCNIITTNCKPQSCPEKYMLLCVVWASYLVTFTTNSCLSVCDNVELFLKYKKITCTWNKHFATSSWTLWALLHACLLLHQPLSNINQAKWWTGYMSVFGRTDCMSTSGQFTLVRKSFSTLHVIKRLTLKIPHTCSHHHTTVYSTKENNILITTL